MRIATSIYGIEAALGKHFSEIAEAYAADMGKELDRDKLGWHWVLSELDVPMPRSAAMLLKSDPGQLGANGAQHIGGRLGPRLAQETPRRAVSAIC